MRFNAHEYQRIALDFLEDRPRAGLFLEMGLGKTVIALTYLMEQMWTEFTVGKALVIAPLRVAEGTWSSETAKWDHLKELQVSKVIGTQKQRCAALEANADVYVIGRDNVTWLVEHLGTRWDFDAVIIDELSSFKNPAAKRFKALRKVIRRAKVVIGLTGTPAPKGYSDLWSQIYLLDGGERLGRTLTAYRQAYFHPGRSKGHVVYEWVLNPGAKEVIDAKLSDLCLSMSAEDWLEMPDILYNDVVVRMDGKARKLYDEFERDRVLPLLEGEAIQDMEAADAFVVGSTAAVVTNKLLQMANGAVYEEDGGVFHIHDAKLDALEEIVESNPGQPVLVFYNYQHDRDRIQKRFPEAVLLKDGDTAEVLDAWNQGEIPMLLCHPASAAFGLNMQAGGHIICWFGLTWNLELYTQANARLYRQGQAQSVIVHRIICEDTHDARVLQSLSDKDATQQSLLAALRNYMKDVNPNG